MPTAPAPTPARHLHAQLEAAPLRTDRLALRLPRASDATLIYDGYAHDAEAIRWLSFLPHASIGITEAVLAEWLESWAQGAGELMFVVERAADRAFLGMIGLAPAGTVGAVGYVLCQPAWGRGYTTEATRRVVDLAFAHLGLWRVWATCALPNVASRRVLEEAGMRHEGILRRWTTSPLYSPEPRDSYCFAITRDDWLAQHAARRADGEGVARIVNAVELPRAPGGPPGTRAREARSLGPLRRRPRGYHGRAHGPPRPRRPALLRLGGAR